MLQVPLQAPLYDHADIGLHSASPKQWKKGEGNILATMAGKIIKEKVASKLKWRVHCSTENDPPIYVMREWENEWMNRYCRCIPGEVGWTNRWMNAWIYRIMERYNGYNKEECVWMTTLMDRWMLDRWMKTEDKGIDLLIS